MHNEEITALLSEITHLDEILRDSQIFTAQAEGIVLPLFTVDLKSFDTSLLYKQAYTIRIVPLDVEGIDSDISVEAIGDFRRDQQTMSHLLKILAKRFALEFQLALQYGVTMHNAVPQGRLHRKRVHSSTPDRR